MTEFILLNLAGICIGVVLKTLVPMPFLDTPVRNAWSWVWSHTLGRL